MLALVLVCLLSAQPAPSAEVRLAEALDALDALELERAAGLLEPLVATPGLADDVRARAWLALGLTRASMLDNDGARAAFTAALAIDAQLELPEGTSPKVQQLLERTRQALAVDVRPASLPRPTSSQPGDPGPSPAPSPPPDAAPGLAPDAPARRDAAGDAAAGSGRMPWLVTGGALLAGGGLAAGAALLADDNLGRPFAGRTRDDYDGVRNLGVGALGASALLLAAGAVVLGSATALVEEPR